MVPQLYIALGIAAAAFGAGWTANGWRLGEKVEEVRVEHLQLVAASAEATRLKQRSLDADAERKGEAVATIDATQTKELGAEREQTNQVRADVNAGTVGLSVAATCRPVVRVVEVPSSAPGGGLGDGAAPELTADARQAYFTLRDGIATQRRQLLACQQTLAVGASQGAAERQNVEPAPSVQP